MDSMRTLNTSLPPSSHGPPPAAPPPPPVAPPPEELLHAFQHAATAVTRLYRQTATIAGRAQQAGYRDALEDLLAFLDRRCLGRGDGEGGAVRRWASERLDAGTGAGGLSGVSEGNINESEEEQEAGESQAAAPTPAPVVPATNRAPAPAESSPVSARRQSSASRSPQRVTVTGGPSPAQPRSEVFTFQASHPYPGDADMHTVDSALDPPTVRVEVHPRHAPRQPQRPNGRHGLRAGGMRSLGPGAGAKRKVPFGDFFDLGGLLDVKDMAGAAPKRPRGQ